MVGLLLYIFTIMLASTGKVHKPCRKVRYNYAHKESGKGISCYLPAYVHAVCNCRLCVHHGNNVFTNVVYVVVCY